MVKTVMLDWDMLESKPLTSRKSKGCRVSAFIQARATSTRLPDKIYKDLNGAPVLFHVIDRTKRATLLDDVIIASPHQLHDIPENIREFCHDGLENDVLGRFTSCLEAYPCDYIVRLTADCPMLDPHLIDFIIDNGIGSDYCSNVIEPSFPDGSDVEMISVDTLKWLNKIIQDPEDREHVTLAIRRRDDLKNFLNIVSVKSVRDYSDVKISIDTEDDLTKVRELDRSLSESK